MRQLKYINMMILFLKNYQGKDYYLRQFKPAKEQYLATIIYHNDGQNIEKETMMPNNCTLLYLRKWISKDSGIPLHQVKMTLQPGNTELTR